MQEPNVFIVFDSDEYRIMGVYSEAVDADDRGSELFEAGYDTFVEEYVMDKDVDYDTPDVEVE